MPKRTHGMSRTRREHPIWQAMLQRCTNPRSSRFDRYGGRGITVCERWKHSFENFLLDMGPRPSVKHSIDRIDNDGPYSPENCRWATQTEQMRHMSRNRLLTMNGVTKTLTEWAREYRVPLSTLRRRLQNGDDLAAALTRFGPIWRSDLNGDSISTKQMAHYLALPESTLCWKLRRVHLSLWISDHHHHP